MVSVEETAKKAASEQPALKMAMDSYSGDPRIQNLLLQMYLIGYAEGVIGCSKIMLNEIRRG